MLKSQTKFKKSNEVIMLPARFIQPNPHQPRKSFNWDDLEGLAESIHYNGLLQPITVRKRKTANMSLFRVNAGSEPAKWPVYPQSRQLL